ncbi:MAG TPA: LamG-like jellyroll fold domain-containing protein [Candidatus Sulfopaludibacter sp.]|nr:LamG-like jellyroll fold domain-containing protein [Candidatus Sulfopaludibacter sp.]
MQKNVITYITVGVLALTTGTITRAQTYSNAVMGLNPVGYWPLNETVQPPQPLNLTATNLGSLGATGNGYYGAWYQPSGNTWYLTNNIAQTNAITFPFDGSKALLCQAAPGQYVVVPRNANGVANPGITLKPPFSIEAWLQIGRTNSALGTIVSEGGFVNLNIGGANTNDPYYGGLGTGWAGVELGQYQDYLFLICQSTNGQSKANELDTSAYNTFTGFHVGQWVHVVAMFDGTTESIYTNGVLSASKAVAPNGAGVNYVPDPTTPLMIGSGSDVSASYGIAYQGSIDDVAIYTNVLSTTSIQNHFQTAYGTNATFGANYPSAVLADHPVLYYRLNDPQVQTNAGYPSGTFPVANNYGSAGVAGNGVYQPGTAPGAAGPAYAGFGANSRGVAINGWLGAVDVGNSNLPVSLNPTGAVPMTVVSWFKTAPADAPGRFQEILGHGDSSYRLALGQTAGENHFNPGPGPELQFASPADVATNGFAFNDGQWHMVAGVSDGTNEYLYLDGALAKASNNPAGLNIAGNATDLLLGGDSEYTYANAFSANTIRNFDGDMAQVSFWTNALSAAQLQSLFNAAGVPPYFWLQPVSQTNNAGVNITVTAGVRGSSPLAFRWYQNGAPVAGQTNMNLSYTPSVPGNAGTYYLVASNSAGSVTSAVINLVLYGPPTIEAQSSTPIQVFAGANPVLHVTAGGAQPLSYQWTSNGVPIAGATSSNYTIVNAQTAASYGCTVSNFVSTASISPISLTVLSDPTAPYPQQVLADGPVAYFRLDEASGTTAFDYVGGNNGTYTNVTLGVPGYNSNASIHSDPSETAAEFGDFPPGNNYAGKVPPYLNFGTPNGANAEFSVEAWFTQYLYTGGGDAIVALGYGNGGEQFILDTGAGPSGALRFFVRNSAGTVSAANSTYVPANDGLWHHVVGVCDEANGNVSLYMDGNLIASGTITANSGLLGATAPLSIGARESGNNGLTNYDFQFIGAIDDVSIYNYPLTATQVANHYYASGIAPIITQLQPTNQISANQGGNVSVTVTAVGTTPFTYQWKDNNNNPISGATGATLNLTNVQTTQAGNYTVTVGNTYGSSSTNFNLSVGSGPPTISVDLTPTNLTAYAGTLETYSITVGGSGQGLSYQWYRDGAPISGATSHSYTFTVLGGTNTYFCAVTNNFSGGVPTDSRTGTVIGIVPPALNPVSFGSRTKITFGGYNRTETLQDFPVLVRLGTNVAGFSYSQFASGTGGDLRFTDASGTNEIPYEIDEWNPGGISSVWVQVPALSGTNSTIWAYWGNAAAVTPPAFTTNGVVWIPPTFQGLPSYEVVYHLEQSGFPYLDSTLQYPGNGTAAPLSAAGIVGQAASFAGNAWIDAGDVNLGNEFTLSAWVNITPATSNIQGVWVNGPGGYTSAEIALFVNDYNTADGALLLGTGDGTAGQQPETATGLVTTGQWHLLTAAVNRSAGTVALYVDGTLQGSGNTVTDFPTNSDMNLGRFNAGAFAFNGLIDESRIHAGVDDANWTWASYETVAQNASFETYSAVSSSAVTLTIQRSGNNVILTWPQGTLQSASTVNGTYNNVAGATSPYTNAISGATQFYRVRVQ